MAECDDIEHWDAQGLENVIGTMDGIHKSHVKLGDTLEGVQANLSSWGGLTADAWHRYHGKVRVDVDEQGHQAKAVADKLRPLYDEVLGIKSKYRYLKATIVGNGSYNESGELVHWKLNNDGSINTSGVPLGDMQSVATKQQLEDQMKALLHKADAVDAEIADALKAITTPGGGVADGPHVGQPDPKPSDPSILASGPIGGADGNPPYPNGAKPTMIPGKTIPMADNPPGYDQNVGPGPARDQAWKDYLSGKNADGTQRAIGAPMALPKPEAVSDKSLRAIGAAGRSQGVSYAWGGNTDVNGPSKGHGDNGGGADDHQDWNRTGFDCGGLVRYSFQQGAGVDVFERPDGKELGSGTDRIDISKHLTKVPDAVQIPSAQISSKAQVGDILVFFNGGTEHTGIYVGNGFMLDAPYSGVPVRIDNANRDGRITDVLRLNS